MTSERIEFYRWIVMVQERESRRSGTVGWWVPGFESSKESEAKEWAQNHTNETGETTYLAKKVLLFRPDESPMRE